VGSANSSNSNRLREVAERNGVPAYLVDDASAIDPQWIAGKQTIGVSAGASAPEVLVQGVIARLQELGMEQVEELAGVREDVVFPVPRLLRV
jgi:4-hydroxy-3-methylbut-2-enyl diphosphate reductase